MRRHDRTWPAGRPAGRLLGLLAVVLVVAGACGTGDTGQADASFDPSTPCAGAARQTMTGAYPDLEARVPIKVTGIVATTRTSGRFCAKETLGTVWDAGIHEVEFGGAVFEIGDKGGVQTAVWKATGLTTQLLADEYRTGAQADQRVSVVSATNEEIAGRPGFRLNLVNGESRQAILVWPSRDGAVIQVVIAADVDESVVQDAVTGLG